jgi:hypothetical protein
LSEYESYNLPYIEESSYDERKCYRSTGWAPLRVTPTQVAKFHYDHQYRALPAYLQDAVLLSRATQGSTDNPQLDENTQ